MLYTRKFAPKILLSVFLLIATFIFLYGLSDYSLKEALKVLRLIDKIQKEQLEKREDELRNVTVTEKELNSYFAYRIETEKEEVMKELCLKLFKDNRIEGKIFIDLNGQKIPKFLRPHMNFYLGGRIEVEDGKVRLVLKELFLENQPVQPMILDLIIYIASKISNTEASSMNDWYELPYGIKDIKTQQGKATFYY